MPIATPQGTLDFKSVDKVTFVGASSNTVIDTTTGSLGVGVGVGGPTSNLHVVGNTRLEGDINMLHTANTASIKLNSNVVTEFPRSKKLIKYPRVAIASGQSGLGNGYTQDGYIIQVSSEWGGIHLASNAFNSIQAYQYEDCAWLSSNNPDRYTPSTGIATTEDTFQDVNGSWIGLTLPEKIKLSSVHLYNRRESNNSVRPARKGIVWGSDGGSTWYRLKDFTNGSMDGALNVITVESGSLYDQFRVQITEIHNDPQKDAVAIGELEFYGIPEYDSDAHGTDVIIKSVPNVPNTDWLEVYYDGRETSSYSGSGTTVNDLALPANNGTLNGGVGFDSTYKAFTFDGVDDYITTTLTNPNTKWVHSVSVWVYPTDISDDTVNGYIFAIGPEVTNQVSALRFSTDGFEYTRWQSGGSRRFNGPVTSGKWHHVTLVSPGSTDVRVYLDGRLLGYGTDSLGSLTFPQNTSLSIGRFAASANYSRPFNGSIANFRLFNRALTQDEIYQLYAYQKEYFGHGDLSMTLKAGRLGIGTSEPRAALDVRGSLNFGIPNVHSDSLSGYGSIAASTEEAGYAPLGNDMYVVWGNYAIAHTGSGQYNWTWYFPNNFTMTVLSAVGTLRDCGYGYSFDRSGLGINGYYTNRIAGHTKNDTIGSFTQHIHFVIIGKKV